MPLASGVLIADRSRRAEGGSVEAYALDDPWVVARSESGRVLVCRYDISLRWVTTPWSRVVGVERRPVPIRISPSRLA